MIAKICRCLSVFLPLVLLLLIGAGCDDSQPTSDPPAPPAYPASPSPASSYPASSPQPAPAAAAKPSAPPDPTADQVRQVREAVSAGSFRDRGQAVAAAAALLEKKNPEGLKSSVINCLVVTGAQLLDGEAQWADSEAGRQVYDLLKSYDGSVVTSTIVKRVSQDHGDRLRVLFLAVKLGIPGSESRLNQLLLRHGDKAMAEDFLNSGSDKLHDGGAKWAEAQGYNINTGPGSHRATWGGFN